MLFLIFFFSFFIQQVCRLLYQDFFHDQSAKVRFVFLQTVCAKLSQLLFQTVYEKITLYYFVNALCTYSSSHWNFLQAERKRLISG